MFLQNVLRSRSRSRDSIDPHTWKLPTRFHTARSVDDQPKVPDPSIFKDLPISSSTSTSELAVHLCLLECFYKFKQNVLESEAIDTAFKSLSWSPSKEDWRISELEIAHPENTTYHQSRKWNLMVDLAVARFDAWWHKVDRVLVHAAAYSPSKQDGHLIHLSKDYLPPLDVLMVWHGYLLGTVFNRSSSSKPEIQSPSIAFPFKAIYDAIDSETFNFDMTKSAQNVFRTHLKQSPDPLTYFSTPPAYTEIPLEKPTTDLAGLVHAQETFMNEAHRMLWIRSPALQGSLRNSLRRYNNLALETLSPASVDPNCLPFDIALAWKTHQLKSSEYHQDAEAKRSNAKFGEDSWMQAMSKLPDKRSCLCWTCEAIKSATENGVKSLQELSEKEQESIQTDLGFHVAVETARAAGRRLPVRDPWYKVKKDKNKDEWVEEYGLHYFEKIIPAQYDKNGVLVKPEQKVKMREGNYATGFMWTMLAADA